MTRNNIIYFSFVIIFLCILFYFVYRNKQNIEYYNGLIYTNKDYEIPQFLLNVQAPKLKDKHDNCACQK